MTKQETYTWKEAFVVANHIRSKLEPHCLPERIMIVGSLRRGCETVHDIDIVLQPKAGNVDPFQIQLWLHDILGYDWKMLKGKSKIVSGTYADIPIDLYFATPNTWWTLVVIRTGSKEHNIKLCRQAMHLGMKLHADGSGITLDQGPAPNRMFHPQSEQDIFAKLQLTYVEPKERIR